MIPAPEICRRARLARDPRFDGRFVIGVVTTGIYCRPVCPARAPAEDNVRYYPTSATAQDAGFRPCRRCRPENAPRLPEWTLGSQTVIRGLRLIDAGFLDEASVELLACELGVSKRHLDRLFQDELGTTPKSLAMARRVYLAKRLIESSSLPFAEVALRAGYGSVRRFNDEVRRALAASPRELRGRGGRAADGKLLFKLPVREPYNVTWVFSFLAARALPGLEEAEGHEYRRRLTDAQGNTGWLRVRWRDGGLEVELPARFSGALADVLRRVRRVFDLDADPLVIDEQLRGDPVLGAVVADFPGVRVPGAWDGFETTVRAILGQQVSVARATRLAGLLCERFGGGTFPDAAALLDADVAAIGMPGQRGAAIRAVARSVTEGELVLDEGADPEEFVSRFTALKGIGPWTAGYVGMRVARDPDAFPDGDWVVLKMLDATAAGARRAALAWQPWRAYAVMYLWRMAQLRRAAA